MCLFMIFALSSWLTKLMASAGHSLGSALTFVLVMNVGAMIGAIGGGWLADRFHIKYVLAAMYALAAVSITLLGFKMPAPALFSSWLWQAPPPSARKSWPTRTPRSSIRWRFDPPVWDGHLASAAAVQFWRRS
jgi:predicted MFS family arabinose efflux permease